MPRPKTQSDESVLETGLALMHEQGPEALTFASFSKACGLSGATLVQRFGNKSRLKQRTLLFAWDGRSRTRSVSRHRFHKHRRVRSSCWSD